MGKWDNIIMPKPTVGTIGGYGPLATLDIEHKI
jgi:hypothetical protein